MRSVASSTKALTAAAAVCFTCFELYTVGFGTLSPLAQRATMLAFAMFIAFLSHPLFDWISGEVAPPRRAAGAAIDLALVAVGVAACVYLILEEEGLADRSGAETPTDLFFAAIGPLILLELVRRVAGLALFFVAAAVFVYGYLGDVVVVGYAAAGAVYLVWRFADWRWALGLAALLGAVMLVPGTGFLTDPSTYPYAGASHDRLSAYTWLTSEGTFGSIAGIMSEFIFIFILFAAFLEATGAGTILINLAFALTGRMRGGPAQSAVLASSMFGMVSGSTMANVVSTGTFTIPLMIRTGFSRTFSGAVEAVASCGGQIVPPIMGASVFIMSEIVGVPYVKLMGYALIPAFLYFACLAFSIYFEARRIDIRPVARDDIPDGWEQVRRGGYLLVPVAILLASIVSGQTPGRAGFNAVLSLMVMVDLVRSLSAVRARLGPAGLWTVSTLIVVALLLVFGPVRLPDGLRAAVALPLLGDAIDWQRCVLVAAAVAFAVVPRLWLFPIVLPMALGVARWDLPSEIAWLTDAPVVGALPILTLAALGGWLILLAVLERGTDIDVAADARAFGLSVIGGMERGARNSLSLVGATTAIGLIVGILVLAAVGVRLSIFVSQAASASLFLAFVLVMLSSLVLGMGLPTVAAYLLLVVVVAPALAELGVSLIASHMFIFYFGVISSITPPVALAAFAASGISGANAMRTGFLSCRLAITGFIVPFLFVYYPEILLLEGGAADIGHRAGAALAAMIFVAMAAMGHGLTRLTLVDRALLIGAAFLLVTPPLWLNLCGLALGVAHVVYQTAWRARRER